MKVVPVTACFQRRDRDFRPCPLRAYGARKFMKIAQSQGTMRTVGSGEVQLISGAVEAVTLSDPEHA